MKIERARIDGFGVFESFSLELGPGLNVVFGPNEAGKSTLLAFIRGVLFGFDRGARYEPHKGAFGGELWLQTRSGPLVVRRVRGRRNEGELSLRTAEGEPATPARLQDALCGISRELFCEVFAFGLTELSSFQELAAQGGVSQALFAAGIQGGQRFPEVFEALKKGAEARYGVRGKRPLNQLLLELESVQEELRAMGDRPADYAALVERRERIDAEVARLDEAHAQAVAERDRWARLESVLPGLADLDAALAALGALPPSPQVAPDAAARLDERLEALARATAERIRIAGELARARDRSAALSQHEPLGVKRAPLPAPRPRGHPRRGPGPAPLGPWPPAAS